jgi:flagellar protein FliO/FliZ
MSSVIMNVFQIFVGLLVFAAILFLAYVATRYIGSKTGNTIKGKYISVVESISIGMDKNIHLLKAGEQFILIASSGKNIEFLTTIKIDDFGVTPDVAGENTFDFKHLFDKYLQNFRSKKGVKANRKASDPDNSLEEYVFKSNLDKLKSINIKAGKQDNEDGVEIGDE